MRFPYLNYIALSQNVLHSAGAGGRSFPILGAIFGGISGGIILLVSIYFGCIRQPSKKRRLELMEMDHQERIRRVDQELSIESSAEVQRLQDEEQRGLVLAEQERDRLTALERVRLANMGKIEATALEKQRLFEAEQLRLAELEKRRCLEAERQRLPEEERLRLVKADTLKLTEEIQLKLSAWELARLAEAEEARLENQKTVRSLRSRVESVTQHLVAGAGAGDGNAASIIAHIPEERLVPMDTAEGLCPISGGDAVVEVLHRVSLDCHHAVGAPALNRYLEGSVNSGPFPLRCPLCLDGSPTAGVITESPLRALVAARVITEELCRSILVQQIRFNRDQASLEVLFATSKACPFCSIRISHYRGHASHHVTPGGGCPSCHNHFCYSCLGHRGVGAAWEGCPNGCKLLCDDTCSCADCPDCQRGTPCVFCSYPTHTECRVCSSL
jgi:hypothetical protein